MRPIYLYVISLIFFYGLLACKGEKTEETVPETGINPMAFPAKKGSALPYLFAGKNKLLMSWVTTEDSLSTLYFSEFHEDKWSDPEAIAAGTDWFVNWADFPAIAENNGNLFAHYLKKSDTATYAYDIYIVQKPASETSWEKPLKLHRDTTKTEHGFVSSRPYGENSFTVSWLDGRNTSGGHHGEHGGAMTLRSAVVNPNGSLEKEFLLDESVCDCCQTSTAVTEKGPVVVYRDRSEKEVRDMSIVRRIEGNWTKPKEIHKDNWEIFGCPVNGPKADAIDNVLAVAWYTAAQGKPQVNLIFSADSGESFLFPVRVDSGNPEGRVDVHLIDKENALVSWLEASGEETLFRVAKVNISGEQSEIRTIAASSASRAVGFPQMEIFKDTVYFAWTHIDEGVTTIKTASASLKYF